MKTAADEGDVFADYDFIYGENATGFIVNFTEMEEICPDMTDEDRALLKGPTRIISGYRSNSECTQTFLVTKVRYDSCTESSCFCVLCATIKGPDQRLYRKCFCSKLLAIGLITIYHSSNAENDRCENSFAPVSRLKLN